MSHSGSWKANQQGVISAGAERKLHATAGKDAGKEQVGRTQDTAGLRARGCQARLA